MSYNNIPLLSPGDAVFYNGEKHKGSLCDKGGKPFKGWIHWFVNGEPDTFVVFFPDTKEQDSYILHARDLSKARPPKQEKVQQTGPMVEHMPSRRKKGDDE